METSARSPYESLITPAPSPLRRRPLMSHRPDQIASLIKRAVQDAIGRGLNDPRVRGLISVTRVLVDPDMSNATVFVSVLPEGHAKLTMHGLENAAGRIRRLIGRAIRLRRLPVLTFRLDDSLKRQARLEEVIKETRRS